MILIALLVVALISNAQAENVTLWGVEGPQVIAYMLSSVGLPADIFPKEFANSKQEQNDATTYLVACPAGTFVTTTGYQEYCNFVQPQTWIQGPNTMNFNVSYVGLGPGGSTTVSAYVPALNFPLSSLFAPLTCRRASSNLTSTGPCLTPATSLIPRRQTVRLQAATAKFPGRVPLLSRLLI